MIDQEKNDTIIQTFVFAIKRTIDNKTQQAKLELKTESKGISLPEAAIILEGWVNKVKEKIQEPFVKSLEFTWTRIKIQIDFCSSKCKSYKVNN